MKIERLIQMIMILLQNKKVTASYLAEKFDVSKRTIYRDITDLCLAGIPITTQVGNDGGIIIEDDYKLDKTLFTQQELQAIFSGLLSLDSISTDKKYQMIMEKFHDKSTVLMKNHILIDLSSHYKDTLSLKVEMVQEAIGKTKALSFDYYNKHGMNIKRVEPYMVVYQWSNWYIFGFDVENKKFQLYKLNRIWNIHLLEQSFSLRDIPPEALVFETFFTNEIQVVVLFDKSMKYRLIEEYGIDCYREEGDFLRFEFPFTNKDYLFSWLLSFGGKAELIEPHDLRMELRLQMETMLKKYV